MNSCITEYRDNNVCIFRAWAPLRQSMQLRLLSPVAATIEMEKNSEGYFVARVEDITPGTTYLLAPDHQQAFPDPASQYQPEGVHGPSAVVDHNEYQWTDDSWRGLPLQQLVIYELHVGTFTPEGTFEAIIPLLDDLVDTGINALELMPVCQFSGNRNWGYDGVFPYSVHGAYGGPIGLKKLVDACHARNIAVILDVVYNHIGPEGNYFEQFGPYFTEHYHTPWGKALNYDRHWSDGVRDYFCNNMLYWFAQYHIDGLRLDAIHEVYDSGAVNFWEMAHHAVQQLAQQSGRPLYLIAESDYNSPRVVKPPDAGGLGFNAQWLDDLHHALYVMLYKEGRKQYADFNRLAQLAKAFRDGFVHSGEYVDFRKRKYGASSAGIAGSHFVAFYNNHDQCGNRADGKKLSALIDFERIKLAAAVVLSAPYIPLLFMGDEYGDPAPFLFFMHHSDEGLISMIREGRKKDFSKWGWEHLAVDPQEEQTFHSSKLQWALRNTGKHRLLLQWHKTLLTLRRTHPVMQDFSKDLADTTVVGEELLVVHRRSNVGQQHLLFLFNFSAQPLTWRFPVWAGNWGKLLDSKEEQWMENGHMATLAASSVNAGGEISVPPLSALIYASS